MTQTITQTEVARAFGEDLPIGSYITVVTWTDARGEKTDMLVGAGATMEESEAEAAKMVADRQVDSDGENATYGIVADAGR